MILQDKIAQQLPSWRKRVAKLLSEHGSFKVCDVTVEQIYGGIRGVQIQVTDISHVDPHEGIRLRGHTIPEVLSELPKAKDSDIPLAGGLYYLLMVDAMPTEEQAWMIEETWRERSKLPRHVFDVINSMPEGAHSMTLFSQAVMALQTESVFSREYHNGIEKVDYWDAYLEDSLNLTAKLPAIAAYIYNKKYNGGNYIPADPKLDWSANFAHMIGKSDNREYMDLCRLFFLLHSDHEGANVSAHTAHLVGSALSDVYLSCAAGLNGLAGPLHGLANQECLRWLLTVRDYFRKLPTRDELEAYLAELLRGGKVIPGYGHAVLRTTDPRFTAQLEFGMRYFPDDELLNLVKLIYEVLPDLLKKHGKVKNPWPNVDAINGAMQYHYGVTQFDFYTVLFGVSRVLGFTAHLVWSRALGKPIERPKSLTTKILEEMVEGVNRA